VPIIDEAYYKLRATIGTKCIERFNEPKGRLARASHSALSPLIDRDKTLGCDTLRPNIIIYARVKGSPRKKPHLTSPGEELCKLTSLQGALQ
jgi:hypothetical protein